MHYSKQYIMINKEPNLYKLKDFIIFLITHNIDEEQIKLFFRLHLDSQEQIKINLESMGLCPNDIKEEHSKYPLNIRYIKRVI